MTTTDPTVETTEPAPLPAPTTGPARLIPARVAPYWDLRWLARRGMFAAIAVALSVLIVAGLRVVILGPEQTAPVALPAPIDRVAEAYAVQAVEALYSYDQDHPQDHLAAVREVVRTEDPTSWSGWDGTGRSTVSGATALASQAVDNRTVVQVRARIAGVWRTIVVTVTRDDQNRPVLAGVPAVGTSSSAGQPTLGNGLRNITVDAEATAAAQPTVEGFLRSWGEARADLGVYTADGYQPPAGPGLRLVDVAYRVPTGGPVRDVLVMVRWADSDGRTIPSAYTLTLAQTVTQWRVAGISPAPQSDPTDTP